MGAVGMLSTETAAASSFELLTTRDSSPSLAPRAAGVSFKVVSVSLERVGNPYITFDGVSFITIRAFTVPVPMIMSIVRNRFYSSDEFNTIPDSDFKRNSLRYVVDQGFQEKTSFLAPSLKEGSNDFVQVILSILVDDTTVGLYVSDRIYKSDKSDSIDKSDTTLSVGAIVGISIGGIAFICIVSAVIIYALKKKNIKRKRLFFSSSSSGRTS
jgi:hypothetical protein